MTLTVLIYVFDNVEVLDFAGPFEAFSTATRVFLRSNPGQPAPFKVLTVARIEAPVTARAGLKVLPDHTFANCPPPDILLIPGGVVDREVNNPEVIAWVLDQSRTAKLTASVCTGAFILAQAGLLSGKRATTHWDDLADFEATFPDVRIVSRQRWVDEGSVVTSAGIAAGIDMSLHLVGRFASPALAQATARQLDVPYHRPDPAPSAQNTETQDDNGKNLCDT